MTQSKRLTSILFLLCLCLPAWHARGETSTAESTLHTVRMGKHDHFSRMVFDLEGARPTHLGSSSDNEFLMRFAAMNTSVDAKSLARRLPPGISSLTFETTDGGFEVRIGLRDKSTQEKHFFIQKGRGAYSLVLDFYYSGENVPTESADREAPDSRKPAPKRKDKAHKAEQDKTEAPAAPPAPQTAAATQAQLMDQEASKALYQAANSAYDSVHENLQERASEIIDRYKTALKAAPHSPDAPLALFRLGLSYFAVADYKRGEECFRTLLSDFPRSPLVPLCWLHLGRAHEQRKSPLEAIQALRTAVTLPLDHSDMLEAYHTLSKALAQVGAHTEVLAAVDKCLELDPQAYRTYPDLLRIAGEAYFATQQYDKSTDELTWYLNLASNIPDKDMVLAKIGESLLYQKEPNLAKRVYAYIEQNFPDTEGNVISKIRRAEYLEKQDGNGKDAARFIYQELADKGLSGPLGEYVTFKLATWETEHGNFAKSLELIDQAMNTNPTSTSREEFTTLHNRTVTDYLKQASASKDYPRVIAIYRENASFIQEPANGELLEMAADACLALKLYPNALEFYQQVQKNGKKDEGLTLKIAQTDYFLDDLDRAAQNLQQVRSEKFALPRARLLGEIAFTRNHYPEAVQQFSKILAQDSDFEREDLSTVKAYAESLMQTGKHGDALAVLEKASKCQGAAELASQFELGRLKNECYLASNQPDKAIATLEHLLTLNPPDDLRDRLTYQLAGLYQKTQQPDKAKDRLSQLAGSKQGLWQAAAQQQLDYLDMQSKNGVTTN